MVEKSARGEGGLEEMLYISSCPFMRLGTGSGKLQEPGPSQAPQPKIGPGVRLCQRTYSPLEAP